MTKEQLAELLNGVEVEPKKEHKAQAAEDGLVIVYGESDDLMMFEGAIYNEGI